MNDSSLKIGIELSEFRDSKSVQELKDEEQDNGIEVIEQDNGFFVLVPLKGNTVDTLENHIMDMGGDDVRVQLVFVYKGKDIYISKMVSDRFDEDNPDLAQVGGYYDPSTLPEIVDFLSTHGDLIKDEKKNIINKYIDENVEEEKQTVENEESDNDEQDAVTSEEVTQTESTGKDDNSEQEQSATNISPEQTQSQPSQNDNSNQQAVNQGQQTVESEQNNNMPQHSTPAPDINSPKPAEAKIDPLLLKATGLFDEKTNITIPQFDQYTQRELGDAYLQVEKNISLARQQAIIAIYKSFLDTKNKTVALVEKSRLEPARADSKQTVTDIGEVLKAKVNDAKEANKDKFDADKHEYVQGQIHTIEAQFDATYAQVYEDKLQAKINQITDKYGREIQAEKDRLDNYVDEISNKAVDIELAKIDTDAIIEKFQDQLSQQLEYLENQASSFKGQVEEATAAVTNENKRLNNEIADKTQAITVLKETHEQEMNSNISKATSKQAIKYDKKIGTLQNQLQVEKSNNIKKTQKFEQEIEDLKKSKILAEQQANAILNNNKLNEEERSANVVVLFGKKFNAIAVAIVAMVVTVLLTFGGTTYYMNHNSARNNQPITIKMPKQSNAENYVDSSHLKKGETFNYRLDNGDKVKIHVDDTHSGHYYDKDGKYHSVGF